MASARINAQRHKKQDDPDTKLSKYLSYVCRHGAHKEGLQVFEGGFINVKDILACKGSLSCTEDDVRRVVQNSSKQRFALCEPPEAPELRIRANQGHSMKDAITGLELTPILSADSAPIVVHGTYKQNWQYIQHQGLSRMKRTHIHFASGLPGESGVISGMRSNCDVLIYIDIEKALADGLKFYLSANNVILCPGNENGFLLPKYFKKVVSHPSGSSLY